MDLKKIKEAINSGHPSDVIERVIIQVLAADKNAITTILQTLDFERHRKEELIKELNLQLSRADVGLGDPKRFNHDGFIQKEIADFYEKNKETVGHCFKNTNF